MLTLPSGTLSVDQITAGSETDVFALPEAGRYWARLAWREGDLDLAGRSEPEGFPLV